jgi:NHL repeat-containing protein
MRALNTRTAHGALLAAVCAALACCAPAAAASGDISTVAGTTLGFAGDGGPAIAAQLDDPYSVAPTPDGGFLVADFGNNRVRKVSAAGTITTVAGSTAGYSGDFGPATAAQLNEPAGVAPTRDGGFLIVDEADYVVRKVRPDGTIVTVAGLGMQFGFSGDGGPATSAKLYTPAGIAVTPDGGFLIADTGNNRIRKVFANGTIVTVAGTTAGGYAGDGGPATVAELNNPLGVAVTPDGGFLIADTGNHRIRRVRPDSTIVTAAGAGTPGLTGDGDLATSALLNFPFGVTALADGGFLIADTRNDRIRRVSPAGVITTVAGTSGGLSGDGGPAIAAQLSEPGGVAVTPTGDLLIADIDNSRVRLVTGPAVVGGPAPAVPLAPATPARLPRFGARTNVTLSLTHARIRPGARLGVTVRNANTFPISGALTGRARDRRKAIAVGTKRFAIAAGGRTLVSLALGRRLRARLARTGRLALGLTLRVTDPAGNVRRVRQTLRARLTRARHPAGRPG